MEKFRAELLPTWYDVDDAGTLQLLREELDLPPNKGGSHVRYENGYSAPFTRSYLAELMKEDGMRFLLDDVGSNPNK